MTPMSSPPKQRRLPPAERREQLLDVATAVVRAEGFGALSIDRVAREADIARTVVYSQFENLDGVVVALIDRAEKRALEQIASVVPLAPPEDLTPDALLLQSITTFTTLVRDNPDVWQLVLFPVEGAPPAARKRITKGRSAVLEQLIPLVAWGLQERGAKDFDAELISRAIVLLVQDGARLMLTDPERYPPERLVAFADMMLGSIWRGLASED